MDADRRAMALVLLELMSGGESDEALAGKFGDHESVAAGATYLAAFAVEALALQRREAVPATVQFLRHALGDADGGDDGVGGVREPRPRPPSSGRAAAQAHHE